MGKGKREQPGRETWMELLLITVLCFDCWKSQTSVKEKLRFLIFSVVVEICLLWALIRFFLGNEPAAGSRGCHSEATVSCDRDFWLLGQYLWDLAVNVL